MRVPRTRGVWVPIGTWAALTTVVIVGSHVSNRVLREDDYPWGRWAGVRYYLDGLVQYDGHRYLAIAADGYTYRAGVPSPIVWFPGYPLLIRAASAPGWPDVAAAVGITVVGACVALVLLWTWLGRHDAAGTGRLAAFAAVTLFPYAWFLYGTVYGDAVFLALVLGALLLAEDDRRLPAAVLGALATATRPNAVALVPALLVLAATHDGAVVARSTPPSGAGVGPLRRAWRWAIRWLDAPALRAERLRARTFVPLLSLAGIGAYAGYLWLRFGDPLAFATNQSAFRPRFGALKLTFASRVVHAADTPVLSGTLVAQAALLVVAVATCGAVSRRFGFASAVLVLGAAAIPALTTHDFMGTGRYLLVAFPAWALIGERLAERPRRAAAVLAASGLVMVAMSLAFSRGTYLS